MKRANLQLLFAILFFIMGNVFAQAPGTNFIQRNLTLSDFGDGVDAAKSIIWKSRFSDAAVQVKESNEQAEGQDGGNQQQNDTNIKPNNPDPEKSAVRYVAEVPIGLTPMSAGPQKYVLGVKAQYTLQGYNWIELTPQRPKEGNNEGTANNEAVAANADGEQGGEANKDEHPLMKDSQSQVAPAPENAPDVNTETEAYRIPFVGKAVDITLWAWGGQYAWWVEVYLRDFENYQYRFNLGNLLYTGWRQKRTRVPDSVVQARKRLPASQPLTFEMIKLWSFPTESVNMFYAYFDLLQTSVLVPSDAFNGEKLANDLW